MWQEEDANTWETENWCLDGCRDRRGEGKDLSWPLALSDGPLGVSYQKVRGIGSRAEELSRTD